MTPTQADLAARAGCSRSLVGMIMQGRRRMTPEVQQALRDAEREGQAREGLSVAERLIARGDGEGADRVMRGLVEPAVGGKDD